MPCAGIFFLYMYFYIYKKKKQKSPKYAAYRLARKTKGNLLDQPTRPKKSRVQITLKKRTGNNESSSIGVVRARRFVGTHVCQLILIFCIGSNAGESFILLWQTERATLPFVAYIYIYIYIYHIQSPCKALPFTALIRAKGIDQ